MYSCNNKILYLYRNEESSVLDRSVQTTVIDSSTVSGGILDTSKLSSSVGEKEQLHLTIEGTTTEDTDVDSLEQTASYKV